MQNVVIRYNIVVQHSRRAQQIIYLRCTLMQGLRKVAHTKCYEIQMLRCHTENALYGGKVTNKLRIDKLITNKNHKIHLSSVIKKVLPIDGRTIPLLVVSAIFDFGVGPLRWSGIPNRWQLPGVTWLNQLKVDIPTLFLHFIPS